jgi:hypothetical protein
VGAVIASNRVKYRRLPAYKYQVLETASVNTDMRPDGDIDGPYFSLTKDGVLTAKIGYNWDGPSGGIDTKNFLRPSLFHDIPYNMHQLGLPLPLDWKPKTDLLLHRLCREDGMTRLRAWWVYQAVKMFGRGLSRDLNPYDETLVAP